MIDYLDIIPKGTPNDSREHMINKPQQIGQYKDGNPDKSGMDRGMLERKVEPHDRREEQQNCSSRYYHCQYII